MEEKVADLNFSSLADLNLCEGLTYRPPFLKIPNVQKLG
jgi:hypothetical protein